MFSYFLIIIKKKICIYFQLLLSMTFSISWCMNAKVITKVAQVIFFTIFTLLLSENTSIYKICRRQWNIILHMSLFLIAFIQQHFVTVVLIWVL